VRTIAGPNRNVGAGYQGGSSTCREVGIAFDDGLWDACHAIAIEFAYKDHFAILSHAAPAMIAVTASAIMLKLRVLG
jgi:hypothetical protein